MKGELKLTGLKTEYLQLHKRQQDIAACWISVTYWEPRCTATIMLCPLYPKTSVMEAYSTNSLERHIHPDTPLTRQGHLPSILLSEAPPASAWGTTITIGLLLGTWSHYLNIHGTT